MISKSTYQIWDYIDSWFQSEPDFLYAVINDSFDKTNIKVKDGWYNNANNYYREIFSKMLHGFRYNIEKGIIPYSMSKFIDMMDVWAIAVEMPFKNLKDDAKHRILAFSRNGFSAPTVYWEGKFQNEDDKENMRTQLKSIKQGADSLFSEFITLFHRAQWELFAYSPELSECASDIYCYIFYPFWDNRLFNSVASKWTVSMATSRMLNINELRAFSQIFLTVHLDEAIRRANSESIKSAKAAIMSRNMSHNLGSHVMFYIKQKLQSVSKIINNDVLHNIITGSQLNIEDLQKKLQNSANIELPFLVGLGRFINYLQERQDYIATVATNYIPARSTISFKDFIYDELKPDLRYERHKRDDSSSDNGWQPKNLLLDYIAYSEGYSKSDAIEIKFGEFDGHNPLDVTAETDFQALRKFNVAVPGGVIGRQAIFSIVENIIRNAAKHSEHCPDDKLVLQLSLVDAEKDFTGDFLSDKFRCMRKEKGSMESGESLVKLYQNHKDAFHILRIKLDMPNKEDDIEALVGKLGEDYVEEDGSMKETSKGLKEMRISAAWLRGHSIDTAIPTTEPPVLAVYSEPYKNDKDKETISYFLCIPKPCKVAFVVEDMAKYTDLNDEIKPFGCQIFEYVEQNEKNQDNKEAVQTFRNQIADYEIVCMDLEEGKGDCILPYISSRYITNSATTKSILDELKGIAKPSKGSDQEGKNNETQYAQIKTAIDSIYEKWFEEAYGKVNNQLLIVDDKTYEKYQTQNDKGDASQNNIHDNLGVILRATGTAEKEDCENSVIYSTHFVGLYTKHRGTNDNDKTKSGYELLQSGVSIESITGNNSTDRLVRQDEWNKEWKYKHLSAGLSRVAIFDERIFGSFITEKNSNSVDRKKVSDLLEGHNREPMSEQDIKKALIANNFKPHHAGSLANAIINKQEIDWEAFYKCYVETEYSGQFAQKNCERRIWAFNIEVNEQTQSVDIIGYDAIIGDNPDWADANVIKPPIIVATLQKNGDEYNVLLSNDGKRIFPKKENNCNSQIFDYITIHQGILDKIYNYFGIKEKETEKDKVTSALYRGFSKSADKTRVKDKKKFLPNFIIHSGRSKPNEKDMPQHQPFVQFAAIDHAVKDCKYTLVELLATAHYEQGRNNN